MENKFCYLKGIVDCDSGRIQDCNNKRTTTCPLEHNAKGSQKAAGLLLFKRAGRLQRGTHSGL